MATVDPEAKTVVAQCVSVQRSAAKLHADYLAGCESSTDLATDQQQRREFRNTDAAKTAVEIAPAVAAARAEEAQAKLDNAIHAVSQPGDAAQESRNSRIWARSKAILDAEPEPGSAVATAAKMLENSSGAELGVLHDEISPYMRSRRMPDDWVNASLARRPEMADFATEAIDAEKSRAMITGTATMLERAFAQGRPLSVEVLDASRFDPDRPHQKVPTRRLWASLATGRWSRPSPARMSRQRAEASEHLFSYLVGRIVEDAFSCENT